MPGYCLASSGTQTTDPIATTDVTFTIGVTNYAPVDCYGIVDTGSSNVSNNLTYVNNLSWQNFANGLKDDAGGGNSGATVIDNISYTLTTGTLHNPGTLNSVQQWTLSWSDNNGAAAPNLPASVDLVIQWNGGNKDVFFLFEDVVLSLSPNSGSGAIQVKVTNNPGNADIGTSHLIAFLSNATPVTPGDDPNDPSGLLPIPEPGTFTLVGLAMLLLGGSAGYRRGSTTR